MPTSGTERSQLLLPLGVYLKNWLIAHEHLGSPPRSNVVRPGISPYETQAAMDFHSTFLPPPPEYHFSEFTTPTRQSQSRADLNSLIQMGGAKERQRANRRLGRLQASGAANNSHIQIVPRAPEPEQYYDEAEDDVPTFRTLSYQADLARTVKPSTHQRNVPSANMDSSYATKTRLDSSDLQLAGESIYARSSGSRSGGYVTLRPAHGKYHEQYQTSDDSSLDRPKPVQSIVNPSFQDYSSSVQQHSDGRFAPERGHNSNLSSYVPSRQESMTDYSEASHEHFMESSNQNNAAKSYQRHALDFEHIFGSTIPDVQWLNSHQGTYDGYLIFVQAPSGDVHACQWNQAAFQWAEAGVWNVKKGRIEGALARERLRANSTGEIIKPGSIHYFRAVAMQREQDGQTQSVRRRESSASLASPTPSGANRNIMGSDYSSNQSGKTIKKSTVRLPTGQPPAPSVESPYSSAQTVRPAQEATKKVQNDNAMQSARSQSQFGNIPRGDESTFGYDGYDQPQTAIYRPSGLGISDYQSSHVNPQDQIQNYGLPEPPRFPAKLDLRFALPMKQVSMISAELKNKPLQEEFKIPAGHGNIGGEEDLEDSSETNTNPSPMASPHQVDGDGEAPNEDALSRLGLDTPNRRDSRTVLGDMVKTPGSAQIKFMNALRSIREEYTDVSQPLRNQLPGPWTAPFFQDNAKQDDLPFIGADENHHAQPTLDEWFGNFGLGSRRRAFGAKITKGPSNKITDDVLVPLAESLNSYLDPENPANYVQMLNPFTVPNPKDIATGPGSNNSFWINPPFNVPGKKLQPQQPARNHGMDGKPDANNATLGANFGSSNTIIHHREAGQSSTVVPDRGVGKSRSASQDHSSSPSSSLPGLGAGLGSSMVSPLHDRIYGNTSTSRVWGLKAMSPTGPDKSSLLSGLVAESEADD
ncbi:hypothetical protein BT63DRAFT_436123 [Microthyrium microscopicum]|uniref:Uncharacterized protein n=1 Tax=Microthyrium microscopicum TaxID=703497 RepID=A0A6A6UW13_9PEZI|nr:hypothetical protein BT63DRAFT_436123 [Microthyrium microscopicum]